MTLALYGKTRRRQGVLIMLGLVAVFAAMIGSVAVQHSSPVQALETANLVPVADGDLSNWSDVPDGASDHLTVTEGACAPDTDYITTGDNSDTGSLFDIDEVTIPDGSTITRVDVTFCYSDNDAANGNEGIQPFVNTGSTNFLGTAITFGGSTTPTLATTQQIDVTDFVKSGTTDIEIGVISTENDDVRVYAIWAVVQYTPPAPDLTATKTARNGVDAAITQVTQPADQFSWRIEVKNAGSAAAVFPAAAVWLLDNLPTGATYGATATVTAANPNTVPAGFVNCPVAANTITCTTAAGGTLAAGQSLFVTVSVDPTAAATITNPNGVCKADNSDSVVESNEGNNVCAASAVTVNAAGGPTTVVDAQGANDEPGQKDLTQMSVDATNSLSIAITWNWDETGTSGANTLDACALFDTDGDGNANFSLCQTTTGDPAAFGTTTLYSCNDTNSDRCGGSASISTTSTCTIGTGTNPFDAGPDAKASCNIVFADFGAGVTAANLLDVCSYPSQQPNSDPSDCIIAPTASQSRTVRVMKVTTTAVHPAGTFTGTISPGGDTSFSLLLAANAAVSPAEDNIVSTDAQTVTETGLPADWINAGYYVQAASGQTLYTCSGTETYTAGPATVPQGTGDYTVCIKNTYTPPTGSLVVHKIEEGALDNTANTWNYSSSPTGGTASITNEGSTTFTVVAGTYTVTETNGSAAACSTTSANGAFTTSYSSTENGTYTSGTAASGLQVVAGQTTHIWFKNASCPGTVAIAKSSSPEASVAAGGAATWTVTVTVGINPTISAWTITDDMPTGFVIAAPGITSSAGITCGAPAPAPNQDFSCTLAANSAVGVYTITIPVTAPANFPPTNCTNSPYNNSATISGGAGSTISGAATATDPITVTGCINPSLALSKSNNAPSPLASDGTFNWTVTAVVTGGPTVADATITDTLPGGFTINAAITDGASGGGDDTKMSCTANAAIPGATGFTCTLLATAPNGTYTITVPVMAPAVTSSTQCRAYDNEARASFPENMGTVTGSPATDTVTVVCPTIAVSKVPGPTPVNIGQNVEFIVRITNTGTVPANGISVTDALPTPATGMTWNAATTMTFAPAGSSGACSVTGVSPKTLGCSGINLAVGQSVDIRVTATTTSNGAVRADVCTTHTNTGATAGITGITSATQSGSASVTVDCPTLTIAKAANPVGPVNAGSGIGWTLTVSNGTAIAASNVSVSDTLPIHTGVVWSGTATNTGGGSCSVSGGSPQVLTCTGLTVGALSSITIEVTGTTTAGLPGAGGSCGTVENSGAFVTYLGGNTNQVGTASVVINCPDPSVNKSSVSPINAGDPLSYSITVTPGGTGAQTVIMRDVPPAGFTWTIGGDDSTCVPNTTIAGGSEVTCTFVFAAGNSPAKSVTLTSTSTPAECPTDLRNTATIEPGQGSADVNTSNNSDFADIDVQCPSVTLTKTADAATANAGDQIGFTITVANAGPGTAKGFSLTDPLPANGIDWSIQSQTGPAITCQITGALGSETLFCPNTGTVDLAPTGGSPLVIHVISLTNSTSCGLAHNEARITVTNNPTTVQPAAADTTVNCPDITVDKTTPDNSISATETATFVIAVTNGGPGVAKNVTVSDVLPGLTPWTIISVVPPAVLPDVCAIVPSGDVNNPLALSCSFASMADDAVITITVSGPTPPSVCGPLDNLARAVAGNEPANLINGGNDDDASISVNCADIELEKIPDAPSVTATNQVGYTIRATNNGAGDALGVVMTDTVPTGAGLSWTIDGPNPGNACTLSSGTLTCNWGTIGPSASKQIHIISPTTTATCEPGADNDAFVDTSNDGDDTGAGEIDVLCPDVSVSKTANAPTTVSAGGNISFNITVNVGGPAGVIAKNVMLNDLLPQTTSGWTVTNDPDAPAACPANPIGLQLICSFGDVTAPDSFTITVSGQAIGSGNEVTCGPLTNAVRVTSSNERASDRANNQAQATVNVNCPNIVISKSGNGPLSAGEQAQFTVTVTNNGAGTATGVVVKDLNLPGGLSWTDNHDDCVIVGDNMTCQGGAFASMPPSPAAGSSISIVLSATTNPASCPSLVNQASASANNDTLPGDGSVTSNPATIVVNCPDISVSKTANNSPINAGDTASFTVTVQNSAAAGTGAATSVVVTDQLPDNGIAWTTAQDDCSISAAMLMTCTVGTLDPGESFAATVTGTTSPAQCGTLPNQASATATNEDPSDTANNTSDLVSITVNCPDVVVSKTPDAGTINAGENAVFTIVVTNNGLGTAYNATLTDDLPDGFTWSPSPGDPTCNIVAGILTCSWATLLPGDANAQTVTLTAPTTSAQCQAIPNTAVVDAGNESDTGAASENNSDAGAITVNCPDIVVTKVADATPVEFGDPVSFTIKVTNLGPGVAKNVVVTDDLPDGIAWTTSSAGCVVGSDIVCTYAEILVGDDQAKTIEIESATVPDTCDPIVNAVSAVADNEPSTATANNSATATVEVNCGSIQVVKIDQVGAGNPNLPADGDWDFTITGPNSYSEARSIPVGNGGGSVTIDDVPLGAGYAVVETEAIAGQCPAPNPTRTYRTTGPGGSQDLTADGEVITFTFTNFECGVVLSTGFLEIHKVEDMDGDHVQDPGEIKLAGWAMTVTGPQFPGGQVFLTDANGRVLLPGILTGLYTVTEGSQPGYQVVGVVVDDNALVFSVANTGSVDLTFLDTDILTFFNQPRGSISARKIAETSHNGGAPVPAPDDDDGWVITLASAQCGINTQQVTNGSGLATFSNLPICSDYQVSENPVNAGSPGFNPVGPTTVSNVTPGRNDPTEVMFRNRRLTVDPPCTTCAQQPTPTPTNTPTPTPTPTNTPLPSTPTPVSTVSGERTPGPGAPTPIAPSTGESIFAGPVAGMNFLLVLLGLAALAGGLFFVAMGKRRRN